MSASNSERLLQHIRCLAGDPPGTPSDGELLLWSAARNPPQPSDQKIPASLS